MAPIIRTLRRIWHFLNFRRISEIRIFLCRLFYAVSADQRTYLQEDLGSVTLFDFLGKTREEEGFSEKIVDEYKKVLCQLPRIQLIAGKDIDYSCCYPREAFDKQSMMWDLNYFKYYFLKLSQVPFDEQALENDFQAFTDYLLAVDDNAFLIP